MGSTDFILKGSIMVLNDILKKEFGHNQLQPEIERK
jgi:hypothetical protein